MIYGTMGELGPVMLLQKLEGKACQIHKKNPSPSFVGYDEPALFDKSAKI